MSSLGRTLGLLLSLPVFLSSKPAHAEHYISMPSQVTYSHAARSNQALEASVRLAPQLDVETASWRLMFSARFEGDAEDHLEPGRPALDNYSGASKPLKLGSWGRAELRDAWIEVPFGRSLIKVGKQQIIWGNLDGIKVLDVLNPQRFREFILEDFESSRIATWSAYLDLQLGAWRAELAAIPDASAHEIPEPGAWFELTAPRFRYGAEPNQPIPQLDTQQPSVSDGTVGGRLSRTLGRLDLGLIAASGLDFEPLGRVRVDLGEPVIEQYYKRRALYGLQAETALGGLVFRMEASYQPNRTFNTRTENVLGAERLTQWRVAAGVDMDAPLGIFLNAQYLHDQVMDGPDTLIRPKTDRIFTVFAQRRFLQENLLMEARWYGEPEKGGGLTRVAVEYQVGTDTRLQLTGDYFYGGSTGIFGQFERRDRISLVLERTF